ACAYPGSMTQCRAAGCMNGRTSAATGCDGKGACPPAQTTSCGTYACVMAACGSSCAKDTDCAQGAFCSGGAMCIVKLPPGQMCTSGAQCASGFCVDHVCCDGACQGQCSACNVMGMEGTCTAILGAPVGGRAACA